MVYLLWFDGGGDTIGKIKVLLIYCYWFIAVKCILMCNKLVYQMQQTLSPFLYIIMGIECYMSDTYFDRKPRVNKESKSVIINTRIYKAKNIVFNFKVDWVVNGSRCLSRILMLFLVNSVIMCSVIMIYRPQHRFTCLFC